MKNKYPNTQASMNTSAENFRMLFISLLASMIGIAAGFTAYGLYTLIALVSNLVFFHRVSVEIPKLQSHILGYSGEAERAARIAPMRKSLPKLPGRHRAVI